MAHDNDYHMDQLLEITFEGMPYWIMPRYVHHYVHNNYERFSLKLIKNLIKPGDTFLDIGAHYGAYSVYAAAKCEAQVIAMEPVNENFEILRKNVTTNKLGKRIELHNAAASDEDGEAEFNIPWASDSAGFYQHPLAETYKTQHVTVRSVDALVDGRRIDFIKIDTEGHELTVLSGLRKTLRKNPGAKLLIEANPSCLTSAGRSVHELLTFLRDELDKELFVVDEDGFMLRRITDDIDEWEKFIDGYANVLCMPRVEVPYMLMVCHNNQLDGGERALLDLVGRMRQQGTESHVVVPYEGPLRQKLIEQGISHSVISYGYWLQSPDESARIASDQRDIEAAAQIAAVAERIRPTCVANNSLVCPWGILAARTRGLPLVWLVHEFGDLDHGFTFRRPITAIRSFVAREADLVVACSEAVASTFRSGKIVVHYPLGDLDDIRRLATDKTVEVPARRRGALRIGLSGRMQASKGHEQAVEAIARLTEQGVSCELLLFGSHDKAFLPKLKALIRKRGLTERVQILGFLDNPFPVIASCDVMLMCSPNEAFGRATAEAMALSKPVVGVKAGGTAELIADGRTGLLYEPGDTDTLVAHLQTLQSVSKREKIGKAAAEVIADSVKRHSDFRALIKAVAQLKPVTPQPLYEETVTALLQDITDKARLRTQVADHEQVREELLQEIADLKDFSEQVAAERDAMVRSRSWKITRPLRSAIHYGKGAARYPRKLARQRDTQRTVAAYASVTRELAAFKPSADTTLAVVVHLYYPETWPAIRHKLRHLAKVTPFDVFVTVREGAEMPDGLTGNTWRTHVMRVPNRGRDVMPFMLVAPTLQKLGYESFLKLHSKRSTHRTDGADWFANMLNSLVPEDPETIKAALAKLGDAQTGVIGPKGEYVSLVVNYRPNRRHINGILSEVVGPERQHHVDVHASAYGFMGGTMFWARFDSLSDLFARNYGVENFDVEEGQIDATFGHALERVFSVLTELRGQALYEIGQNGLQELPYASDNIPDWSDVYVGPKPAQ